jgi:ABC-type polysaccharide/polyol phosphate export permease
VLYPIEIVSEPLRDVISMNPLTPIFELARKWVIDPGAPGPAAAGSWLVVVPVAAFVVTCALAAWVFDREAPRIAEEL